MRKFDWDYGFERFLDREMVGGTFFDVVVGNGRPQRLYPESPQEFDDCLRNVTSTNLNPTLGSLYPGRRKK
jgi:hypothetical protein